MINETKTIHLRSNFESVGLRKQPRYVVVLKNHDECNSHGGHPALLAVNLEQRICGEAIDDAALGFLIR